MNLEDAIKKLATSLESGETGGGLPLCRYCGEPHEPSDICPSRYCRMCGTIHPHNRELHTYKYCERNETFYNNYKAHLEWVKKNTAEIWTQPDREVKEEE